MCDKKKENLTPMAIEPKLPELFNSIRVYGLLENTLFSRCIICTIIIGYTLALSSLIWMYKLCSLSVRSAYWHHSPVSRASDYIKYACTYINLFHAQFVISFSYISRQFLLNSYGNHIEEDVKLQNFVHSVAFLSATVFDITYWGF